MIRRRFTVSAEFTAPSRSAAGEFTAAIPGTLRELLAKHGGLPDGLLTLTLDDPEETE